MVVPDSPGGVAPLTPLTKGRCPIARLSHPPLSDGRPVAGPDAPQGSAPPTDWRGWIALAWVVFWGSAYAVTAIRARAPQLLHWFGLLTGSAP
jgi:hypothetical protein